MRVFAAIDLRGGAAVQLVGGDPGEERVRVPDPAGVARRWLDEGFTALHVVDLDAALGDGENDAIIRDMAAAGAGLLQVGGGVRDEAAVARVLDRGADRAVVGTRAIEDPAWLQATAAANPGRLVVAADVKDGVVVTRGWTESTGRTAAALLDTYTALPLAAVLVTDVTREGRQQGIDGLLFAGLVEAAAPLPLIAAGGITTTDDLMALRDAGVAGAVLGMALYTGRIAPADALAMETE